MPDQTILSALRDQLRDEADRLATQIAELDAGEGELSYDENFADSGQVAAEQGENRALRNQLGEQLDEIEHARAKFDDGSYGICEVCRQPIGEARLEAMPATRYCIQDA